MTRRNRRNASDEFFSETHSHSTASPSIKKISWSNAKSQKLKRYYTGVPCHQGHVAERYTSSAMCVECVRLASHSNLWKQYRHTSYINHRSARISNASQYAKENSERINERQRDIRNSDPEKYHNYQQAYHKEWRKRNRTILMMKSAQRRADKLNATPKWLTYEEKEEIHQIYQEAQRKSLDGVKYHVDHIVPLKGANVCGLHVPWNLQAITETENARKHNKCEVTT